MPTKIRVQNVQPETKIAGAVVKELRVKSQGGGGPPKEATLPSGGELEFTVGDGVKVTVQEIDDED